MMDLRQLLRLILISLPLLAAACQQPAPILMYVSPTPQLSIGAINSPTPGEAPAEVTPTATMSLLVTNTPGTSAPVDRPVTAAALEIAPNATIIGPLIGPDYTLPPTSTPRPSETPTEGPSPTVEPSSTPGGPQPTPVPFLDPAQMGIQLDINLDGEDWRDAVRRVQENLSLGWVKVQISWEAMQPNGPDEFGVPFQQTQLFIQELDGRGFNVLVSVAKAPAWARSNQNEDGPPDDPQLLANFITFMFSKFGERIDAIEIWNEPNLAREWQGTLPFNGAGYMQLFRPAYGAVRGYSATMPIIVAGLAPTGDNPGSIDDRSYLQQMYNAGLTGFADVAIGAHPYSWANSPEATCCGTRGWDDDPHFFFNDTIREYKRIMDANGHATQPIWVTEFGWATWDDFPGDPPPGSEWMRFTDQCEQAHYTLRAFEIAQQDDRIGLMILWNLNFALLPGLVEARDERIAYSLVLPSPLPERPLYWLLYDAVRPDEVITDQCQ
jgi:hypothetical protein